jgi:phosphohistidine phosphatase SixA
LKFMRHLDSPAFGETSVRAAQWRTALFAVATIALGFVFSASALADDSFDRPALLMAADEGTRADIGLADRHILIVRHARKAEESCNALDCPLGDTGLAMVARLNELLGDPDFDAVYSSGACRTYETALPAGDVIQHAAAASAPALCGGGTAARTREDAIAEAIGSDARWSFVAEHSNTSCNWIAAIAGADALAGTLCESGQLTSADYGDVFWLYRIAGEWRVEVLEGIFDVAG